MMRVVSSIFAALAALTLASCGQGDVLYVDKVVINVSPVEGNPSSGYLELHGGRLDVALVSVISDDVLRIEMHETVEADGVATMQPIKSAPVPRGETVKFIPGGKHLMVWGVGAGSVKRGTLPMIFIFSNDDRIVVDAVVKKIGNPSADPEENQKTDSE